MANSGEIGVLENCRIEELAKTNGEGKGGTEGNRNTQAVAHIEFDIIAIDYRYDFATIRVGIMRIMQGRPSRSWGQAARQLGNRRRSKCHVLMSHAFYVASSINRKQQQQQPWQPTSEPRRAGVVRHKNCHNCEIVCN